MMTNSLDILIEELLLHARIGCSPEERIFPQRLLFSLEISTSASEKFNGDLEQTVCYAKTSELITQLTQSKEWILLEDLADEIVTCIFNSFTQAKSVSLTVKKFAVPHTSWTGIRYSRHR
jgi:FolB domain-containing protein